MAAVAETPRGMRWPTTRLSVHDSDDDEWGYNWKEVNMAHDRCGISRQWVQQDDTYLEVAHENLQRAERLMTRANKGNQ